MHSKTLRAASAALALVASTGPAFAEDKAFSGSGFQVNRDRVTMNWAGNCAKSQTIIVPTVYLNVEARNSTSARKGSVVSGGLGLKARVFVEGMDKPWLQGIAQDIQNDLVAQLRAAGKTVLTWEDIKGSLVDAKRMAANPKFGVPVHNTRFAPGIDFVSISPSDDQALDYGLSGPTGIYKALAKQKNALVMVPEIWLTLPQVGAQFTSRWDGVEGKITFDPSMRLFAANLYSDGPSSGCLIVVPEHGGRIPAPQAGQMEQLAVDQDDWGDYRRGSGDFAFVVDRRAVEAGAIAVGRSFNSLVTDVARTGRK